MKLLKAMKEAYQDVVDKMKDLESFHEDQNAVSPKFHDEDWKTKARKSLGKRQKVVLKVMSQQVIECAHFIRDESKAKNFC